MGYFNDIVNKRFKDSLLYNTDPLVKVIIDDNGLNIVTKEYEQPEISESEKQLVINEFIFDLKLLGFLAEHSGEEIRITHKRDRAYSMSIKDTFVIPYRDLHIDAVLNNYYEYKNRAGKQ